MDKLTPKQWSALYRAQRKFQVSSEFLKYNYENIKKFIRYAETPRMVLKQFVVRRGRKPHIIIKYNFLRRVLFDECQRKTIRERKRNIKLWSMRNLNYLRRKYGVQEYVESVYERGKNETDRIAEIVDDVSKQMKEQLEILKTGKRTVQLIDDIRRSLENNTDAVEPADSSKVCVGESDNGEGATECSESNIVLNGVANNKDHNGSSEEGHMEKNSSLIGKYSEEADANLIISKSTAEEGKTESSKEENSESNSSCSNQYVSKKISEDCEASKMILVKDANDTSVEPMQEEANSAKSMEDATDSILNGDTTENKSNSSNGPTTTPKNSDTSNTDEPMPAIASISEHTQLESACESATSVGKSDTLDNQCEDPKEKASDSPMVSDSLFEEPATTNKSNSEVDLPVQISELTSPAKPSQNDSAVDILPAAPTPTAKPQIILLKKPSCSNFLDMLINKVGKPILTTASPEQTQKLDNNQNFTIPDVVKKSSGPSEQPDPSVDSADEFLGFEEAEGLPGMLKTPVVPNHSKSTEVNSAFVSESLNEYMRKNLPEISEKCNIKTEPGKSTRQQRQCTGLVTPDAIPPHLDMPAVPESLQRLRTVAERRLYLHRSSKNHKLSIINNEATIYRELQRKMQMRHHKKTITQQLFQSPSSQQPYTRDGWKAASFLVTEYDKYYYQTMEVINGDQVEVVKLPGVRGNNESGTKPAYRIRQPNGHEVAHCDEDCLDMLIWRNFRIIKSQNAKAKKLNSPTLRSLLKPCPLSQKPFQKPIDEDAAAMLLAGGSMAVVRMPTVDIEVFPAVGKPLDEIAQRYLQYILPHHDISREWAEFSVSTLQHSDDIIKSENAGKKNSRQQSRRKSFIFAIPYANDRTHILVRRVVDRSEQLDESFKLDDDDASITDLSFAANIDKDDAVLTECATIVSELINSVAISCSENSFIKSEIDPDDKIANEKHESVCSSNANAPRRKPKSKTSRLISELKRLNATVIDAATAEKKKDKPCPKDYCALGCVCKSLTADYPMRQHCGKAKCMFECNCKNGNASRIMRLETDSHSITTEDAYMLRRKATERLSRMEKDFTSTVVLTGSETLLINESQYDKKRRCTKAPKRYDTEDEVAPVASKLRSKTKPSASVVAIDASSDSSFLSEFASELKEPVYVSDTVIEKLKHCEVTLTRLEDTKNMTYWCMVHELYKCFCGGHALEGKRIVVEKEETALKGANKSGSVAVKDEPKSKYKYKYEQVEESVREPAAQRLTRLSSRAKHYDEDSDQSEYNSEPSVCDTVSEESSRDSSSTKARRRTSSHKLRRSNTASSIESKASVPKLDEYTNSNPHSCRRVLSLPRKLYLERNRRRVSKVLEFKKKTETAKTDALLNERIIRSVYYNRQLNEKTKAKLERNAVLKRLIGEVIELSDEESKSSTSSTKRIASKRIKTENMAATTTTTGIVTTKRENISDEDTKEDELLRPFKSVAAPIDMLAPGSFTTRAHRKSYRRNRDTIKEELVQRATPPTTSPSTTPRTSPVKQVPSPNQEQSGNEASVDSGDYEQRQQGVSEEISIPKIAECFSLNASAVTPGMVQQFGLDPSGGEPQQSLPVGVDANDLRIGDISVSNEQFKDFYNGVITHMNNLVSKKMQDIDMALRRESKLIPPPNEEILCIVKWSNFVDAFKDGFVFIWVVKMKSVSFLAATTTNVMPVIIGAVGVVNLAAFDTTNKLPLFSRMLLSGFCNEKTRSLAVVMQGRAKYWRIKGFLRPDESSACVKPTPDSHPTLTRKINLLCSLLIKQRVRDYQNRLQQRFGQHIQQQVNGRIASNVPQLGPFVNVQQQMQASAIANKKVVTEKMVPQACPQLIQTTVSTPPCVPSLTPIQPKPQPAGGIVPIMASSRLSQPTAHTIENGQLMQAATSTRTHLKSLRDLSGHNDYGCMESNVTIRRVTRDDIEDIEQPEQLEYNHRWLVLDLYNDFSHIFVPAFGDLVSLDRIHRVMAFCTQKQKIVKLQFFQHAPFDAYVTPNSKRKIYFGPLRFNTRPPVLILLQSVDGVMMLREVYQQKHNITVNPLERTTAFWILQRKGRLHFEFDDDGNSVPSAEDSDGLTVAPKPGERDPNDSEEDDDCILIEDNADTRRHSLSSDTSQERINFTIQTSSDTNQLQLTQNLVPNSIGSTLTPLALPTQAGFVPIFSLPPSAVITNVTPAPQDMPYGATVFISNKSNITTTATTPTPAVSSSSSSSTSSRSTAAVAAATKQRKVIKMQVANSAKPALVPRSSTVASLVSGTVSSAVIAVPVASSPVLSKSSTAPVVTSTVAGQTKGSQQGKTSIKHPISGSISMMRVGNPPGISASAAMKAIANQRVQPGTSLLSSAFKRRSAPHSLLNSADPDHKGPNAKNRRLSLLKTITNDKGSATRVSESPSGTSASSTPNGSARSSPSADDKNEKTKTTTTATTTTIELPKCTIITALPTLSKAVATTATTTASAIKVGTSRSSPKTTTTTIGCTVITKVNDTVPSGTQSSCSELATNGSCGSSEATASSKDINDLDLTTLPASLSIVSNNVNSSNKQNDSPITIASCKASIRLCNSLSTSSAGATITSEAVKRTSSGIIKAVAQPSLIRPVQTEVTASKLQPPPLCMATGSRERALASRPSFAGKGPLPNTKCLNINNRSYVVHLGTTDDASESSGISSPTTTSVTAVSASKLPKIAQKDDVPKVKPLKRLSLPTALVGALKPVGVTPSSQLVSTSVADSTSASTSLVSAPSTVKLATVPLPSLQRLPTLANSGAKSNPLQKMSKVSVSFPLTPAAALNSKKQVITAKRVSLPVMKTKLPTPHLPTAVPTLTEQSGDKQSGGESKTTAKDATATISVSASNSESSSPSLLTAASASTSKPLLTNSSTSQRSKMVLDPAMVKLAVPGFFCTQWLALPRYAAKRIGNDFLIKTSSAKGYLLRGEKNVNSYLNEYLAKREKRFKTMLPAEWKFVLQSNLNSQMNKVASADAARNSRNVENSKVRKVAVKRKSDAQNTDKIPTSRAEGAEPSSTVVKDGSGDSSFSSADEIIPAV